MMRGPRNLLWVLPLALVALAPLWWGGAADFLAPRSDMDVKNAETNQRPQVFVVDDALLKQHTNGVEEWNIRSRRVSSSNSGETLLFDGVTADLFRHGRVLFHIVSKAGRYEQKEQRLGLAGDVSVKHRKGAQLFTQQLYYMDKLAKITTKAPVRMIGDGMELTGKGFEHDMKTGSYSVGGRVKVVLR
ncbi:MAG: LPS export ABC transporter periplasmic protein LptC [Desulfobulbaceae bacterium]|nr:LPS export ABC transporter periplasmic protein LptC [Desulfobulbaceae bacterium]